MKTTSSYPNVRYMCMRPKSTGTHEHPPLIRQQQSKIPSDDLKNCISNLQEELSRGNDASYSYGNIKRYNQSRKSHRQDAKLFKQGVRNAKISDRPLYTTGLDPCVAVMIAKNGVSLCMHIDEYSEMAKSKLIRYLGKASCNDVSIGIVGANQPGSQAKALKIIKDIADNGFLDSIKMVSVHNGHNSVLCIPEEQKTGEDIFYVGKE